ncbi:MAG: T9SS type A sorting domain-containing protein [Bacteroidales bacterium]|nr:T9SS type A sorting domain-containing protein [Bacteroidales bacterium]
MRTFILLLIFFGLFPLFLAGQLQLIRYDSIPVIRAGDTLELAWAGGFNSPQFSAIDFNGDGVKDLFAFERNYYGMVKTFLNKGIENEVGYVFDGYYQTAFPQMSNWALLADYNCDGKADIFTSVPFGMAVYRNDYSVTDGLKFTRVTALLKTSTANGEVPLYVSPPDIPAIADVDNDGDLDILTFDIIGKYVEFHKNRSVENTGSCGELDFELESACWGYFSENETNNGISLHDSCSGESSQVAESGLHAGSVLLALDLNGTGLKDLLIGDISHNNVVELTNGGTPPEATMVSVNTNFPSNSLPVDLTVFPAAFHLDVNNDGKRDLLFAPNNPNTSENIKNVWLYENSGTDENPVFSFASDAFLQEQMIDVGAGARPVFFDYNGDELMDIVIGNFGVFIESGIYESKLSLYQNTGTEENPAYSLITNDYSALSSLSLKGVYPAFGDLDGDGKMEMLSGDEEGNIHLFVNTAAEGEPAAFTLSRPNYKNIDVGQTAMPQIVDVNRDGKPDLLIGERSGTINYFENTGTPDQPDFGSVPTNGFFGEIDVMLECCTGFSAPFFSKDSTGKSMLFVGSEKGYLYLYNNIDNNLEGAFTLVDSLFLNGLKINISGADINNDNTPELLYGEYTGGIAIMKKGSPAFVGIDERPQITAEIELFPNPATSVVNLRFSGDVFSKHLKIDLFNIYGETVKSFALDRTTECSVSLSGLTKGIYFVRLSSEKRVVTKKIIKH